MRGLIGWLVIRDAVLVIAVSSILAIVFNSIRKDGIPLVASEPYHIFVPCPEPSGVVFPIEPSAVRWRDERELIIDARTADEFGHWHAPGAVNVPFDFLDPVAGELVRELIDTRSSRVVVYGDGGRPDTGEELASELSGRGMLNVHFVPDGAVAVREGVEP
jgi:rhodanese-related sulfurtransferase